MCPEDLNLCITATCLHALTFNYGQNFRNDFLPQKEAGDRLFNIFGITYQYLLWFTFLFQFVVLLVIFVGIFLSELTCRYLSGASSLWFHWFIAFFLIFLYKMWLLMFLDYCSCLWIYCPLFKLLRLYKT